MDIRRALPADLSAVAAIWAYERCRTHGRWIDVAWLQKVLG